VSGNRIAMVSLSPLAIGGIETHLLQIFRGLRGEFDFLAIGRLAEPFQSQAEALGVTCVPLPSAGKLSPAMVWRLRSELRAHNIAIMHSHDTRGGLLGRIAARLAGSRIVHTVHTPSFFLPTSPLAVAGYQLTEGFLNRYASDRVIFVSETIQQMYLRHGLVSRSQARCIHNGLEPEWFELAPSQPAAASGITFLYIGRLSPEKGLDLLGDAFGLAVSRHPEMRLQVVGGGVEGDRLVATARREGWSRQLQMSGSLPRNLARRELQQADAFVLPSRFESMSYTLLEAMACGRAVIATDVGGNRDLVEPGITGLLVPPKNPNALADAMVQLAEHPVMRAEYGRAGRQKAERYTLVGMIDALRNLYRELVA
jgi:glycosyltransferase involved in cell wall biosynthesis